MGSEDAVAGLDEDEEVEHDAELRVEGRQEVSALDLEEAMCEGARHEDKDKNECKGDTGYKAGNESWRDEADNDRDKEGRQQEGRGRIEKCQSKGRKGNPRQRRKK